MTNKVLVTYNNNNDILISYDNTPIMCLTQKEAYQLCDELEKMLFDEKTYKELEEEVLGLELKIEKLEEELSYYKELLYKYNYYYGW